MYQKSGNSLISRKYAFLKELFYTKMVGFNKVYLFTDFIGLILWHQDQIKVNVSQSQTNKANKYILLNLIIFVC